VAEGGGLLNRYTKKFVSEVRILSAPPDSDSAKLDKVQKHQQKLINGGL
jgi:hypothetical protein